MTDKEIIVIGAGPGGITASIYLKRAGYSPYLIESHMPGGKIPLTYSIENYPGFDTVSGSDLAMKMVDQLTANQIDIHYETVLRVRKTEAGIRVETDADVYRADAVVIASGTREKKLGIKGEEKFLHRGISFCAVCDGGFFKNKPMAVIGGGNSALEEALYLEKIADPLYLIHRRKEFRGDLSCVEQVKASKNIRILTPYIPLEFKGGDRLEALVIQHAETKEIREIPLAGAFEYVGAIPNTDFLEEKDLLDERGYILVNPNMETSIPGIFAAGDVTVKELRQIVTANGDGAIAAIHAAAYLKKQKQG